MHSDPKFPWGHSKRYNDFSTFFRRKFSGRVQKISIDAGFTCPNRDGLKGVGGCTYCNNRTFNPEYCATDDNIVRQLTQGIEMFSKKYDAMRYLAYFQAYTNTYAPVSILESFYNQALAHPNILGLVVATRPDCLGSEVLNLLHQISKTHYVMVEIGVETHLDQTLRRINRGHTFSESVKAIEATAELGLNNCVHMILGLPGETERDFLDQARTIAKLPIQNLKLHQMQIHRNTQLANEYAVNPENFNLFDVDGYIETVIRYIELLNPSMVIERFVSESPGELLIAPNWGLKNFEFVVKLERRLKDYNTWQGRMFEK
jgi:uncharacterized protein